MRLIISQISIVFLIIVWGIQVESTHFEECPEAPPPTGLRIDNCVSPPCQLIRGKNLTAHWNFTVDARTLSLKAKIKIIFLNLITVDYPLKDDDACKSLVNGECPLDKDEEATYALNMPVLQNYPKVDLRIQFFLIDGDKDTQVCFIVPAKVIDE